jgi:tetratricopeptide (TPR) repeat protein
MAKIDRVIDYRPRSLVKARLRGSRRFAVLLGLAMLVAPAMAGAAGRREEAQRELEKGTAAFGLGNYSEAAEAYEKAFKLVPDAALLYNAAQSHRLAGHKPRALELYKSYVRVYRRGANRAEAATHIENLTAQIEAEKQAAANKDLAPPPPSEPEVRPASGGGPRLGPAAPPPPPPDTGISVKAPPPAEPEQASSSRTWLWVAIGAAAVGAGVAIFFATRKSPSDPMPTLGTLPGN